MDFVVVISVEVARIIFDSDDYPIIRSGMVRDATINVIVLIWILPTSHRLEKFSSVLGAAA